MSVSLNELEIAIEKIAPKRYAEDWDNTGYNIKLHNEIRSILVCVDVSHDTIKEAVTNGCDTIVSHHPLIFKPIKQIDLQDPCSLLIAEIVSRNLNVYCSHTSMDTALGGINDSLANLLELHNVRVLAQPEKKKYYKIAVCAPLINSNEIKQAMFNAGAGQLGNYTHVATLQSVRGEFMPGADSMPYIGQPGNLEIVQEIKIEVAVDEAHLQNAIAAAKAAHPYECPVIDVYEILMDELGGGAGRIGELASPMNPLEFAEYVKLKLDIPSIKYTPASSVIRRVAVFGGSAAQYMHIAQQSGADAFITGEMKHSDYKNARIMRIMSIDAGHYDTEKCFVSAMTNGLQNVFSELYYNGVSVFAAQSESRPYSII